MDCKTFYLLQNVWFDFKQLNRPFFCLHTLSAILYGQPQSTLISKVAGNSFWPKLHIYSLSGYMYSGSIFSPLKGIVFWSSSIFDSAWICKYFVQLFFCVCNDSQPQCANLCVGKNYDRHGSQSCNESLKIVTWDKSSY